MAVQHTFLAGTSINYTKSLFFDLMKTGDIYLGFARTDPLWGFALLMKLDHTRTWPTGVMGQSNSGTLEPTSDEKFYDRNSEVILLPAEVPVGGKNVFIAHILQTANATLIGNYTFLDINSIGALTLDYMNENWAQIQGINEDFFEQTLAANPLTTTDYYLFNHAQNIASRTQIEVVSKVTLPELNIPVRLQYSTVTSATIPTTAFGSNLIGDLVRTINVFGEATISGMKEGFVTDGLGYIEDNSLQSATFFLTTADGVVIQDAMQFIQKTITNDETSIIFSYPLVAEATQNSGRLKLTVTRNPAKLAFFLENVFEGQPISDINPPPLQLNYLKMASFHSSIFDVLGLERIQAGEVDFARRVDNTDTENLLNSVQGIDLTTDIDLITIDSNPDTTVKFAITNDSIIARNFFFDLTRVRKKLNSITPTDKIYRQLFVCYKPKDNLGNALDLSDTTFTHSELFNVSTHQYDLGIILFLVNKVPVFRKHLAQDEDFTLLI